MKKSIMLLALLSASILAPGAHAAKKYLAVLETVVDAQCNACKEIEKSEVSQITEELRRVAINSLPQDRYNIMTKETIQAQESAVLQECASENCIIKLGAAIGANYIVKSGIRKFGPKFTLTVEMYETKNGTFVAALPEPVSSENLYDILEKAAPVCAEMYKRFVNAQSSEAPPQLQPSAPTPTNKPSNPDGSGILTDTRDGKKYKTAVIGGKRWMAENLNYKTEKSLCYNNDNSNCGKYGMLYDWNTAKTVCMQGWHLPSRQEWDNLVTAAGGQDAAGKKLKATSGWYKKGDGTDDYGFSALPGGGRYPLGSFDKAGYGGYWWSATEKDNSNAYRRYIANNDNDVDDNNYSKNYGFSVRCVSD